MVFRKTDLNRDRCLLLLFICLLVSTIPVSAQTVVIDRRSDSSNSSGVSLPNNVPFVLLMPEVTNREVNAHLQVVKPPVFAVKTNVLYLATLTPNLGLEFGLGRRTTLELSGGYHPWKTEGTRNSEGVLSGDKKLEHWLARGEFKYWLDGRFSGHYFGVQGLYVDFDIHGYEIPLMLEKDYYNSGTAYGGGVSYGYHWVWSRRWGVEFSVGAGVIQAEYTKTDCLECASPTAVRLKKTYVGPISAGVKLVFLIQ